LNADDVRPLCDTVSVVPAQVLAYAVSAILICQPGPDATTLLAAARAACQQYVADQFRLGHAITISGLHAALHQPGVARVDLYSPADSLLVASHQAARCVAVDVQLGSV